MSDQWYSDEALRKQAKAAAGELVGIADLRGIYEPRVQPTADERCVCCGSDARDHVGGELLFGNRWCDLCVGRDHPEPDFEPSPGC